LKPSEGAVVKGKVRSYRIKVKGEHGQVHLSKSSQMCLRYFRCTEPDEILDLTVVSAVCGLMNSRGGALFVSLVWNELLDVNEEDHVWELEDWRLRFSCMLRRVINSRRCRFVQFSLKKLDGEHVIQIKCHASLRPVWVEWDFPKFGEAWTFLPMLSQFRLRLLDIGNSLRYMSVRFRGHSSMPINKLLHVG
jgi:hypothetical protein